MDRPHKLFKGDSNEYNIYNRFYKKTAQALFEGNPSLCLAKITDTYIWVKTFEEKRISLNFTYNGIQYRYMRISQIDLLDCYRNKIDNPYPLGTVFAVFSLTDRYFRTGKYYKVVAQILN